MDRKFIQIRFAKIRLSHNISARKLSLELGQSSEYINQIENGKNLPSLEGLFNFCNYFKITLGEFFDDSIDCPMEYKKIAKELNCLNTQELDLIYNLLKVINSGKH